MNWEDLSPKDKRAINRENDQFINDLKEMDAVKYSLPKETDLSDILNAEKDKFIFDYSDSEYHKAQENAIIENTATESVFLQEFKWHFQREYNIYFRYGCELVYFSNNLNLQPLVRENDNTIIIKKKEGEKSIRLPEFLKKCNNFSEIVGYDFLRGKAHFLRQFKIIENPNFPISSEHLYYSYYIAWKKCNYSNLSPDKLNTDQSKSSDCETFIKIGKNFLDDILFNRPNKIPESLAECDLIIYSLFKIKQNTVNLKEESGYFEIPPTVYQITVPRMPVFDDVKDGKIGLLKKLNYAFHRKYKEDNPKYGIDPDDHDTLSRYQDTVIMILENIMRHSSPLSVKWQNANFHLKRICSNNDFDLCRAIIDCCELFKPVQNELQAERIEHKKTLYNEIIEFLGKLYNITSEISLETRISRDNETNNQKTIGDTIEAENYIDAASILESKESNEPLLLLFKTAFEDNPIYLKRIENHADKYPKEFHKEIFDFIRLQKGEEEGNKEERYPGYLIELFKTDHPGKESILQKNERTKYIKYIRTRIFIPLLSEKIIFFGQENLIKLFEEEFNSEGEKAFLKYVIDEIKYSFKQFKDLMFYLSKEAAKKQFDELNKKLSEYIPKKQFETAIKELTNLIAKKRYEDAKNKAINFNNNELFKNAFYNAMDKISKFIVKGHYKKAVDKFYKLLLHEDIDKVEIILNELSRPIDKKQFKEVMDKLSNYIVNEQYRDAHNKLFEIIKKYNSESKLQMNYQTALFPGYISLPPKINKFWLHKNIYILLRKNKKDVRNELGFWWLKNTYLLFFKCYKNIGLKDFFLEKYFNKKEEEIDEKSKDIFRKRIDEITMAIIKKEFNLR